MTRTFKYIPIHKIPDYLNLGWMVVADLGPTHGEYSVLAEWLCECAMVVPA